MTLAISAIQRARTASPLIMLKELRQFVRFSKTLNAVRGRFASFEEAIRSAPGKVGYDTDEHASLYDARLGKILISDYAVLFWLSRIAPEVERIFDIGGHKGELYYGFRLAFPALDRISWVVDDLPSSTRAGMELARNKGVSALSFTNDIAEGDGCDLLIASGVLQYLEQPLSAIIAAWRQKPRYIIVNNTPMYEGEAYITLQNTGVSYNPYRIFNRVQLISSVESQGYALRDHWRTERSLTVPLRPELFVEAYQGFFMELAN